MATNDTKLRLNIIRFASVSKMWRDCKMKEENLEGIFLMEPKRLDSSVIMSHSVRTVLRCFICILISVVMLIMRRCFLFPNVFVFPASRCRFRAVKSAGVSDNKDEILVIIFAINRDVEKKRVLKINSLRQSSYAIILSDSRTVVYRIRQRSR